MELERPLDSVLCMGSAAWQLCNGWDDKVPGVSGFAVAAGHAHRLETLPRLLQEQRSHISIPLGRPPISPQHSHTAPAPISLCLALHLSLCLLSLCLSLSVIIFLPSLYPPLSVSLIISVSHCICICLTLALSFLLPYLPFLPLSLHSPPQPSPLTLCLSSFLLAFCLSNMLVVVEKRLEVPRNKLG